MKFLRVTACLYVSLIGVMFLAFVAAYPLGWVQAYPPIPSHYEKISSKPLEPITKLNTLYKKEDEPLKEYYARLANAVYMGIPHFWDTRNDHAFTRVSPLDNYLLWLYSYLPGHQHFAQYEFSIPQKTVDRGYGFCSQVSRMIYYILEDQSIEAKVQSHPNHVIVSVDGGIIDATYGFFLPYTTEQIKDNLNLLEEVSRSPSDFVRLKEVFSEETGVWSIPENHDSLYSYMMRMEVVAEILKWIPPILLILVGPMLLFTGRNATSNHRF